MIKSALDFPSNLIRCTASTGWNLLPNQATAPVKNFINNRSWVTRTLVKGAGTAAITGGVMLGAGVGGVAGWAALGVGAAIGGRATRIHNFWTGQNLPDNPKAPLLKTAHKIALFESRGSTNEQLSVPQENIHTSSIDKAAQKLATDRAVKSFSQNAAITTTITIVHNACLGLTIDPSIMPKIVREATLPNADLWDVYMKYLGKDLSTLQWIGAHFWFFLTYSIGIIPNSLKAFMSNVIAEGRRSFEDPTKLCHLNKGLRNILDQTSSFLDVYNGATRQYANAATPFGDVDAYRRAAIEEFSGKSLETLTKEFCITVVDQFFPHIPFFETLKQYPIIGWAFTILDYLVGGIINYVGRKILKSQLPSIAQSMIETGIDSTNPSNLPFSIAITNALTQLFIELENTPQAIGQTPLLKPEKLPTVIDKLLDTLELAGSRNHPLNTQQKIKAQLELMDSNSWLHTTWRTNKQEILRGTMVESTHAFLTHLAGNSEQLFSSLLTLLNSPLTEARPPTTIDLDNALQGLDLAAESAFNKLIESYLLGVPVERQKEFHEQLYAQYRNATETAVTELNAAQQQILDASTTDQRIQGLEEFATALKTLVGNTATNQAPLAGNSVANAFYEAFHPLHKELPDLGDHLLNLQSLLKEQQRNNTIEDHLAQIDDTLIKLSQHPDQRFATSTPATLRRALGHIDKASSRFAVTQVEQIRGQIATLEEHLGDLETMRHIKKRILEQKVTAEKHAVPPWLIRTPSLAKVVKAPSITEVDQALAAHEERYTTKLVHLQTAITVIRGQIAPLIREQQPLIHNHRTQLNQELRRFQNKTAQIEQIQRSIQPARVEISPWLSRTAFKGIAKVGTPIGMSFFKKAYHFITMKDPYDAARRILMQSVIDGYKKP